MVHFAWQQRGRTSGVLTYRAARSPEHLLEQVVAAARSEAANVLVVQSTTVARTREIGLRMALGAGRESVLRLVAGRMFALIACGLVLGTAAAIVLGRLLQPALYVPGFDPLSLAIGVAVRRATSIDPMTVLRQE